MNGAEQMARSVFVLLANVDQDIGLEDRLFGVAESDFLNPRLGCSDQVVGCFHRVILDFEG